MEEEEEKKSTHIWTLFEIGKEYNNMRNMYSEGRENYNFYHGRQWEGLIRPVQSGDPIVMNIVKPIIKYKTNIVNQNSYAIVFNPNTYETPEQLKQLNDVTKGLNQFVMRMWEKSQSGKKVKNIVRSAAINSEGIIHFFNDGEIVNSEEIDKNNMYYGNESEQDIQRQPYLLVTFRKPVEDVKNLARKYKEEGKNHLSNSDIKLIVADKEINEQQGEDKMVEEISPMCLVVMMFKRNDKGTINVSAATRTVDILDEQDTKSELYPFAHFVWEEEKDYARGRSEVRGLIDNQIEINRTATRRAIAVKLGAYPKIVYDKERVANPAALDKVGSKIELKEVRADDVGKIVNYLRPATMSPDAYNLQQDLIQGTRELAGAGDVATGQIDPTQASGKAILAVQQASQMPITEQTDNYKYFLEDCAKIIFDIIKTEFIDGLTLYSQEEETNEIGQTEVFEKPFKLTQKQLTEIDLNLKVDITPQSPYDVFAVVMTLENMLIKGLINLEEFTKALPEDSPEPKAELENILRQRREARNKVAAIQQQANALNSAINQEIISQGGMTDGMPEMQNGGNEGVLANAEQSQLPM